MTKRILSLSLLTALFLTSCKEGIKTDNAEKSTIQNTVAKTSDEILISSSTNKEGKKLEMIFNNTKDIVTITFEGEKIELVGQQPASGIWYKNDHYELKGKENDIELTKDGKIIFEHKDDIVTGSLKNSKGQTLDMIFNNTANTAKVYFNGGEQIDLIGQQSGSGIWYKNEHYELRGKGDDVQLTKDGKVLYEK